MNMPKDSKKAGETFSIGSDSYYNQGYWGAVGSNMSMASNNAVASAIATGFEALFNGEEYDDVVYTADQMSAELNELLDPTEYINKETGEWDYEGLAKVISDQGSKYLVDALQNASPTGTIQSGLETLLTETDIKKTSDGLIDFITKLGELDLTDKQVVELDQAFGRISSDLSQEEIEQLIENYIIKLNIPEELQEQFRQAFQDQYDYVLEDLEAVKTDLKDAGMGGALVSRLDGMTKEQAEAIKANYLDILADTDETTANIWAERLLDAFDGLELSNELQSKLLAVDWSDAEALRELGAEIKQTYGEGTAQVIAFNDAVAHSGDITNKSIKNFDELSKSIGEEVKNIKKDIDNLAKSIKGELDFEGIIDLVNADAGLTLDDFTATADGFKLNANSAEQARQAIINNIKAKYEEQKANYEVIISNIKLNQAETAVALAEANVALKAAQTTEEHQQQLAIIDALTEKDKVLASQLTETAKKYEDAQTAIDALGLAFEHFDMYSQKKTWEANQEEIKKTSDKLKELYDRLKAIYDMIAEIDPTKTLKTMAEMLDLDKSDLQATLDLNINPVINKKSLQEIITNLNNQIAVQGATEIAEKEVTRQHASIINNSRYATINSQGVAKINDNIEELRNSAKNAKNQEEFDYYKEQIEYIEKEVDAYNESVKAAKSAATKKKELIKEQQELYKSALQKSASLERRIVDILIKNDEKELENYKEQIEKKKQALQDYLDAVQDSIDKERQMRELADKEEDLRKKERKLSILEMDTSGMYASDIASLQNEIASDRRDLQDTYVDNYITQQQEEIDKLSEAYDRDVTAWENYLEWKQEDMRLYQEGIDSIIKDGTESIVDFILTNSEEVLSKTTAELEQFRQETGDAVTEEISYYQMLKTGGFDGVIEALKDMKDGTTSAEEATKKYTDEAQTQYGDLNGSITLVTTELSKQVDALEGLETAWNDMNTKAKEYLATLGKIDDTEPDWGSGGLGDGDDRKPEDTKSDTTVTGNGITNTFEAIGNLKKRIGGHSARENLPVIAGTKNGELMVSIDGQWYKAKEYFEHLYKGRNKDDKIAKNRVYKSGGYVNYTGPAWVDGTPGQPEAFLDAQDTRNFEQLRDILSSVMTNPTAQASNNYQGNYTIEINVGTLGDGYTVDDLADEIEEKIYERNSQFSITRV